MEGKAMHNRIGPFSFDMPDFDDCGGRTMRRVEVPKAVVRDILAAARQEAKSAPIAGMAWKAEGTDTPAFKLMALAYQQATGQDAEDGE